MHHTGRARSANEGGGSCTIPAGSSSSSKGKAEGKVPALVVSNPKEEVAAPSRAVESNAVNEHVEEPSAQRAPPLIRKSARRKGKDPAVPVVVDKGEPSHVTESKSISKVGQAVEPAPSLAPAPAPKSRPNGKGAGIPLPLHGESSEILDLENGSSGHERVVEASPKKLSKVAKMAAQKEEKKKASALAAVPEAIDRGGSKFKTWAQRQRARRLRINPKFKILQTLFDGHAERIAILKRRRATWKTQTRHHN
ncbi:hypothetical protein BC829DRAFT_413120 [Chytridium lagenaria]|nr:hypothetical protein BC829DRAFT_413120 [Chytridium lagenaria]